MATKSAPWLLAAVLVPSAIGLLHRIFLAVCTILQFYMQRPPVRTLSTFNATTTLRLPHDDLWRRLDLSRIKHSRSQTSTKSTFACPRRNPTTTGNGWTRLYTRAVMQAHTKR